MFFKLALNNVRKSIKDYTIYFLTLSFGICIFYVFNSIESQEAMLKLNQSQRAIIQVLSEVIGYVSVFIAVILGFLIIFANKFLIKRRKKELGLYMTLGMEKGKISRILILETIIIGIVSLVVGLSVGIFLSQGLSVVTAHLFAVDMKDFTFVFSESAFFKSILYFGIIYFVVMIFNTITISKYKLINLLIGSKKNETLRIKNIWLSVCLFVLSVISLGIAYRCIIKNGMMTIDSVFWTAIIMGSVGTLLFFLSLSGFLLKVVQSNKKLYFKNLNMFVLRQLNSKINTTFISMSVICIMLLVAIGTLSTGIAINGALTKDLKNITPFDVTVENYSYNAEKEQREIGLKTESLAKALQDYGLDFNRYVKDYVEFRQYRTELTMKDILPKKIDGISKEKLEIIKKEPISVMTLSDYNKVLALQGKEPIHFAKNQFALNCNVSGAKEYVQEFIEKKGTIQFGGQELFAYKKELLSYSVITSSLAMDAGTVILNDELLQNAEEVYSALNIMLKDESYQSNFTQEMKNVNQKSDIYFQCTTKERVYEQNVSLSAIVTFLALYIGFVFLITCAAVLALQQLSEATDNAERYSLLRKLGAENKMINRALFMQILIYFMMPLALAIVHSVVGISVASNLVKLYGNVDILSNTIFTATILIVIYGGYFVATYYSSKNIIRQRKSA